MPNPRYVEFPEEEARRALADGIPFGPRLHPCACGAGRHAHAGDKSTGACKATGCRKYRADVGVELAYRALDADVTALGDALRAYDDQQREQHYADNPREPGQWSIGASDAGTCPRRIWYRNTPPEDVFWSVTDKREARAGTMIHAAITERLQALFPWREFNVPIRINGLDRDSEIDCYDPVTGVVDEFKTAGRWKWEQVGDFGPPDDTWEQVLLYALALEEEGRLVTAVRLSYYQRENGHAEPPFIRPWDDVARKSANMARDRLMGYAAALDDGAELPRFVDAHSQHPLCGRCEAREHCWSIPEAERLGRSPESLVYLGPKPEHEPIVWACEESAEAREARLKAEKVEEAKEALVQGLPAGRYGQYEIRKTTGASQPDYKAYAGRLEEHYVEPESTRPPLEAIPPAKPRPWEKMVVRRVRKAQLEKEARDAARAEKARAKGEGS